MHGHTKNKNSNLSEFYGIQRQVWKLSITSNGMLHQLAPIKLSKEKKIHMCTHTAENRDKYFLVRWLSGEQPKNLHRIPMLEYKIYNVPDDFLPCPYELPAHSQHHYSSLRAALHGASCPTTQTTRQRSVQLSCHEGSRGVPITIARRKSQLLLRGGENRSREHRGSL